MLNIISKSFVEGEINGPYKVVENLIKGLDILKYPYCINKDLGATSQLWIHDDAEAVRRSAELGLSAVVGPNIYILPRNIPEDIDMSHLIYIQPTGWIRDFWKDLGFKRCALDVWPAAIDTMEFQARPQPVDGHVLIYHKQREVEELDFVKNILKQKGIANETVTYGSYDQKEYVEKLKGARYVIWIGRHETQGIALEEALSMNVPMVVWDVSTLGQWVPRKKDRDIYTEEELAYTNTTSAEYFDERCGIKTKNRAEIEASIATMEQNWEKFSPREYVLENLGLEKQARELLSLFEKHFNIKYDGGEKEVLKNNKKWRNDHLCFKIRSHMKAFIKRIINKKG
ncbi:MAG: hypothetical protein WCO48_02615 [Candidatus Taylorbacteria bacterium]